MLIGNAYSLADLSLSPVFRRKWSSIYEALQDSRPQRQKLMQLYIKQMLLQGRPLLAGDHTAWSRPDALGNLRVSKPLWLAWVGEQMPPLEEV
ncbi:hypothetical protein [Nostoc sp.]|uniref:hypothetical protein n=1 Tax=Nostoc sp. TaxID=1180 RepID=UPI002FF47AEF